MAIYWKIVEERMIDDLWQVVDVPIYGDYGETFFQYLSEKYGDFVVPNNASKVFRQYHLGIKITGVWCITPRRWGEILLDLEEMEATTSTGERVAFPEAMEYISDIQGFPAKWHMTPNKGEKVTVRVYIVMNFEEEQKEDEENNGLQFSGWE